MELSRRFFLGGAISLIAAQTFIPSVNAMGNLPTIYGNGNDDDSAGFRALFKNEPLIFKRDQIAVDTHNGVTIHKGRFKIDRMVSVPRDLNLNIEKALFIGENLQPDEPFFKCQNNAIASKFVDNVGCSITFDVKTNHHAHFVSTLDTRDTPTKEFEIRYINSEYYDNRSVNFDKDALLRMKIFK